MAPKYMVDRLRILGCGSLLEEAADEIENQEQEIKRLRAEVSSLKDLLSRDCPFSIGGQACGNCEFCLAREELLQ